MKRVRINVTQRDIDRGVRSTLTSCPIALAIKRRVVEDSTVAVTQFAVLYGTFMSSPFPYRATQFIYHFDLGKPVKPFTFTLELPEEVLR